MNLSNKTDDYYFLLKKIIGFWLFCLSTEAEDVSAIKFHSLVKNSRQFILILYYNCLFHITRVFLIGNFLISSSPVLMLR